MSQRLSMETMARVLAASLNQGQLQDEDTAALFLDLDLLDARVKELHSLFPASTLHTVAVKANPLLRVLAHLLSLDVGFEAASLDEILLCLDAGSSANRIVFDSPVKTHAELKFAIDKGLHLNIDNFQELNRIAAFPSATIRPGVSMGLRINPQVGQGSIPCTSVASDISKFGVPLAEQRRDIIAAFQTHPWLNCLHSHVGSQGCSLEQLLAATERLLDLALEVNHLCGAPRVRFLDMGGGLPAPYTQEDVHSLPDLPVYVQALRSRLPGLMDGSFGLITEFGRHIHANAAFAAAKVEYVKEQGAHRTALIHLGADMFLRASYQPGNWRHELGVHDPCGGPKQGRLRPQDVAGPLCFAGDYLGRDILLPEIAPGDWITIHDAGAYTLSMWSRYNSRAVPKVLAYRCAGQGICFETFKERESHARIRAFWS